MHLKCHFIYSLFLCLKTKWKSQKGLARVMSVSQNEQKSCIIDTGYATVLEWMAYFDGFVSIFVSESKQCNLL